jgi:hypothetical protein
LDRSDTTAFPDQYVTAITSRVAAVSRGAGARERASSGKDRGAKFVFQPMYRPKILNLRYYIMTSFNKVALSMSFKIYK